MTDKMLTIGALVLFAVLFVIQARLALKPVPIEIGKTKFVLAAGYCCKEGSCSRKETAPDCTAIDGNFFGDKDSCDTACGDAPPVQEGACCIDSGNGPQCDTSVPNATRCGELKNKDGTATRWIDNTKYCNDQCKEAAESSASSSVHGACCIDRGDGTECDEDLNEAACNNLTNEDGTATNWVPDSTECKAGKPGCEEGEESSASAVSEAASSAVSGAPQPSSAPAASSAVSSEEKLYVAVKYARTIKWSPLEKDVFTVGVEERGLRLLLERLMSR